MTTLQHLSQTVIDMQQELSREQRFADDSCHSLLKGIALLREATDALERDIKTAFEERGRAISRVLGSNTQADTGSGPLGAVGAAYSIGSNGAGSPMGAVGADDVNIYRIST
jgi:hypothetical protein